MENAALKAGLRYFCHTAKNFDAFIIEDITEKAVDRANFLCNRSLYHATIKDCIEHLSGTTRPIIFNNQDINPVRGCEDIFLTYNPYTGEAYRAIDWKKYYKLIAEMEY